MTELRDRLSDLKSLCSFCFGRGTRGFFDPHATEPARLLGTE
jgi:hypothetical protein